MSAIKLVNCGSQESFETKINNALDYFTQYLEIREKPLEVPQCPFDENK